jgi:stearoyl-CoA desaturase (delta-9 desaturase)
MSTVTQTEVTADKFPPYAYTPTENRKPPMANPEMPPLFDEPTTLQNFTKHVNWFQSILLISTPLLAMWGAYNTPLQSKTLVWTLFFYFVTGLGNTIFLDVMWGIFF